MKRFSLILVCLGLFSGGLEAGVKVDLEAFGGALGGWKAKRKAAADYDLSGAEYRTYKPEISPTPEGGLFISLRIDHRRGLLASDDHAVLEVTVDGAGSIVSAQSSVALQGRTISSDVVRAGGDLGKGIPGVGAAVKVGAEMTADLSAKLLREKIVEAGRVNFPAAIRHNYNHLFQAIRVVDELAPQAVVVDEQPGPVEGPVQPKRRAVPLDGKGEEGKKKP